MNNKKIQQAPFIILIAAILSLSSSPSLAKSEVMEDKHRLAIGVGAAFVNFDTNAKYTNKDSGRSIFVDLEGTLGLQQYQTEPLIFGRYRFGKRHAIGFSYFQVHRSSTLLDEGFTLGPVGVSADAVVTDDSKFFYLSYDHIFFEDDRSSIIGIVGIHTIDLRYGIDADARFFLPGEEDPEQASFDAQTNIIAPLPLFGVEFNFAFSPKWSVSAKTELVGGKYQDISAALFNSRFSVIWGFSKHVGLTMGYTYFDAVIEIDESDTETRIDYGYTGAQLGLYLSFF